MGGQLYLASTSPRRRDLLRQAGLDFILHPPGPEPDGSGIPADLALMRAREKALGAPAPDLPGWILGVDTVVGLAGKEFGKPTDEADAARMLRALRGREHVVYSGHALVEAHPQTVFEPPCVQTQLAESRVYCRAFSEQELDVYLATGDWADKAGAYGIQDAACSFMSLREGALDTVIGLHIPAVHALLGGLS